jgi:putative exporter of polyketide antibiotics
MNTPEVIRITMLLNILTAVIDEFTLPNVEPLKEIHFEKCFIYALAWSLAGLCEVKER